MRTGGNILKYVDKFKELECIYYSQDSKIYKGLNVETNKDIVIKTFNKTVYDSVSLSKLKNEFEIAKK